MKYIRAQRENELEFVTWKFEKMIDSIINNLIWWII